MKEALRNVLLKAYDRFVLPQIFDEMSYLRNNPGAAEEAERLRLRPIEHYARVGRQRNWSYMRPHPKTPVAFFVFNRPKLAREVFEAIKTYRPDVLLFVADGPRNPQGAKLREQCLALINEVDWPCRVLTNISDINLGCKKRLASGLEWVFENEEEAIILEDDCLPHPDFFRFCNAMLRYYRNDRRVMHVSGTSFMGREITGDPYWFSRHSDIWGWATWKRAFRHYDPDIKLWPAWKRGGVRPFLTWPNGIERKFWVQQLDKIWARKLDTWDFQWHFTVYRRGGLSVVPKVNLVQNIGVAVNATHCTTDNHTIANLKTYPLRKIPRVRRATRHRRWDDLVFYVRYLVPGRIEFAAPPAATSETYSRVVVTHDAPTPEQGVGAVVATLFGDSENVINIRSSDNYAGGGTSALASIRIGATEAAEPSLKNSINEVKAKLGLNRVTSAIAIPYSTQDCFNAIAITKVFHCPLTVWLMDDQNIHAEGISAQAMKDLLACSSKRFAICEELARAYGDCFGTEFQVALPPEDPTNLAIAPLARSQPETPRFATCGNIWSERTLRMAMRLMKEHRMRLDWFGNFGRPFLDIAKEELSAAGIREKGFLEKSELIPLLRDYDVGVVIMPPADDPSHGWQSRLSFPSKIVMLAGCANLPLLFIGPEGNPGGNFIRKQRIGIAVDWSAENLQEAIGELVRNSKFYRANAAETAKKFLAQKHMMAT